MSSVNIYQTSKTYFESKNCILHAFESVDSTNTQAKTLEPLSDPQTHIYLAQVQTQGRGQLDRSWLNVEPKGSQLLVTWSLPSQSPPQPHLTEVIGLSLLQALHTQWPNLDLKIKSPNDLYLDGKKTAGILVETIGQGSVFRLIIGLGLNVLGTPPLPEANCLELAKVTNPKEPSFVVTSSKWSSFLDQLQTIMTAQIKANWAGQTPQTHQELERYRV